MTTLAADKPRRYELGDIGEYPVLAADIIYGGAAVGLDSGNARPLVAGDPFLGFAESTADNAAGAAGAERVRVFRRGQIVLSVVGVTAMTDVGKPVYASDDDTFTLTQSTNSQIGVITRWESGTRCVVEFKAQALDIAPLAVSVGTGSSTIVDVGGSFNQTTLNNIVRSLADKVNELSAKIGS